MTAVGGPEPLGGRPRHLDEAKWSVRAMRGVCCAPYPRKSATAVRGE